MTFVKFNVEPVWFSVTIFVPKLSVELSQLTIFPTYPLNVSVPAFDSLHKDPVGPDKVPPTDDETMVIIWVLETAGAQVPDVTFTLKLVEVVKLVNE